MSFASPLMLLFALTAGVPVLIHLLSTRKHRVIPFSSLHFLLSRHRSMLRAAKLKKFSLLALRILAVLLAALAFAGPYSNVSPGRATATGDTPYSLMVLLDRSILMNSSPGGVNLYLRARDIIADIADTLPTGSEAQLVLYSASDDFYPSGFVTIDEFLNLLQQYAPNYQVPHPEAAIQQAGALKELANFQSVRKILIGTGLSRLEGTNGYTLIEMLPPDMRNVGISNMNIRPSAAGINMPLTVQLDVHNYSSAAVDNLPIMLDLNGMKIHEWMVDVPAGETVHPSFTLIPERTGWNILSARLRTDAFPLDDIYHTALYIPDNIRVLLVEGRRPGFSPAGESFYASLALEPVPGAPEASMSVKTTQISPERLQDTSLDAWDVIVLSDPSVISASLAGDLLQYVTSGGGLILSPGPDTDPGRFNDIWTPVLPGQVIAGHILSSEGGPPFKGIVHKPEHPAVETLQVQTGEPLRDVHIKSARHLQLSAEWNTALYIDDISPLLADTDLGKGRITLTASGLSPSWSNLPVSPLFLPLMHGMVFDVINLKAQGENYYPGDLKTIVSDSIIGPLPETWAPGQPFLELQDNPEDMSSVPLSPGIYKHSGPDHHRLISVNPDVISLKSRWSLRSEKNFLQADTISSIFVAPRDIQPLILVLLILLLFGEAIWSNRS